MTPAGTRLARSAIYRDRETAQNAGNVLQRQLRVAGFPLVNVRVHQDSGDWILILEACG